MFKACRPQLSAVHSLQFTCQCAHTLYLLHTYRCAHTLILFLSAPTLYRRPHVVLSRFTVFYDLFYFLFPSSVTVPLSFCSVSLSLLNHLSAPIINIRLGQVNTQLEQIKTRSCYNVSLLLLFYTYKIIISLSLYVCNSDSSLSCLFSLISHIISQTLKLKQQHWSI